MHQIIAKMVIVGDLVTIRWPLRTVTWILFYELLVATDHSDSTEGLKQFLCYVGSNWEHLLGQTT